MKITMIILRTLLGLLFLFASVVFFLKLMPQPPLKGNAQLFMTGMQASTYLLPLVMGTQLVCGFAFVVGRFVPLAAVVIFPVTLNILLYHIFVDPPGIPAGIVVVLINLFLAYYYRKHYVALVAAK